MRKLMSKQLSVLMKDTNKYVGVEELPTILGETGIPMDLDGGAAYEHGGKMWRDYRKQSEALDAILAVSPSFHILILMYPFH